jgi:site-specific DNA-methyltransferase (adenine-specific)/adenine-specific DNA-methyltransferase
MPTLDWIGKKAVVEHHKQVPFHLLCCRPDLSVGEPGSGNLLVQGDNLLALKALLPYYGGKVKCIYIDPPYNTGNENWVYNDNVNSPEIQQWLGDVVGGEAQDLSRHDKWLCMMYPRLVLLREFLSQDGSLWMSIDDHEAHHARMLLDEIFGQDNFVAAVTWQKRYAAPNDSTGIPATHDYILVYSQSGAFDRNLLPRTEKQDKAYRNRDNDPRGPWKTDDCTCNKTRWERPNLFYPLIHPVTGEEVWPKETRVWAFSEDVSRAFAADDRLWWGKAGKRRVPAVKKFLSEVRAGLVPVTWWPYDEAGHTGEAKREVLQVLGTLPGYMTPKPTRLIRRILKIATDSGDLVLDSFAGSGTTGHAVLQANEEDGGDRRFILVEMEPSIAREITAPRLRHAIEGYAWTDQWGAVNRKDGLGGGFRFCELCTTLFDGQGRIRDNVRFADLARHVFFVETGEPLPAGAVLDSPLLGIANEAAIYLLSNGILPDSSSQDGHALTRSVLADLPPHDGPKVIYGNGCVLSSDDLQQEGITFRQVPYEIKVDSTG